MQTVIIVQERIGGWYGLALVETLSSFSGGGLRGNQSAWFDPTMATSIAAMAWSRVTGSSSLRLRDRNLSTLNLSDWIVANSTGGRRSLYPGTLYTANETVLYIRHTLRKSSLLYGIFAL